MRWDDLFADLESQLEAELGALTAEEHAEEERFRIGRLTLRDRVVRGERRLDLHLIGGDRLSMLRLHIGKDWVSGADARSPSAAQLVVPLRSIAAVSWPVDAVESSLHTPATDEDGLAARLTIGFVLRDLCRRRVGVEVHGEGIRFGTIDRVARDHFDLARHAPDLPRAARHVQAIESVSIGAVSWIRVPR